MLVGVAPLPPSLWNIDILHHKQAKLRKDMQHSVHGWIPHIAFTYIHTYAVIHNSTTLLFMSIRCDAGYVSNANECLLFRSWKKMLLLLGTIA